MNARPVKKEKEALTKRLQVMMTQEQYERIVELATKHGYSNVSEYVRRVALGEQKVNK